MALIHFFTSEQIIFQIMMILLAGIVLSFIQTHLIGKLRPRLEKVNHMWDSFPR